MWPWCIHFGRERNAKKNENLLVKIQQAAANSIHSRVRPPPPVSLGTTSGPQKSRAGCPPLRQRVAGGRRHSERSDPMDVKAAQGEARQDVNTTRRARARIESRGGDTAPTNNGRTNGGLVTGGGAQNRVRSSRSLPPGAAPGSRALNPTSQDSRLAAGSFVWRGAVRESVLARSQHGYRVASRVASSIGGAHTGVRPPPPVSLGTTSGPQDSRAGCPPLWQRATGGRRHPERSDPMDVEAAQGEALQDVSTTRRDRARAESRGGDTAPTNNGRANGGLGSFAQQGTLRSTPERHHQGHWPPLVSDGAHHRVRASPQRPPVTAPGSRDSSLRSQDARYGATIVILRGRLGGGVAGKRSAGVPCESH